MNLYDIIDEFKALGHYEDDEIEKQNCSILYRFKHRWSFLNVGENIWGLRDWYSVADIEEKIAPTIQKFDILDDDDEEDKNLKLLGEDEADDDDDIPAVTDDQETLNDPEDPEDDDVDEDLNETDIVIDEDDEDLDEEDEEEEEFEDEEETEE